jgi:hypothetical protein
MYGRRRPMREVVPSLMAPISGEMNPGTCPASQDDILHQQRSCSSVLGAFRTDSRLTSKTKNPY